MEHTKVKKTDMRLLPKRGNMDEDKTMIFEFDEDTGDQFCIFKQATVEGHIIPVKKKDDLPGKPQKGYEIVITPVNSYCIKVVDSTGIHWIGYPPGTICP